MPPFEKANYIPAEEPMKAGNGISINGNTIHATPMNSGTGISIDGNTISTDLVSGHDITITGNVINSTYQPNVVGLPPAGFSSLSYNSMNDTFYFRPGIDANYINYTNRANSYIHVVDVGAGGVPELRSNTGAGYPTNVHCYYAKYCQEFYPSDDKIKWNETLIDKQRALNIIKDISFTKYDILEYPTYGIPEEFDASQCILGFGVIAQEIQKLSEKYPELKNTVKEGNEFMTVNYNNIFTLMGATIQNLIQRIEILEAKN